VYEALAARGCGGARAGAVAGCFASVVSSPGDLIKTRSMLSGGSARVSIFAVVRAEGVAALWKGTGYRVLYKIASSAVFFACLETYKRLLVRSGRPPA
jgi:Mitochondrial carrier protein